MYNELFIGTTILQLFLVNRYFSVLFRVPDKRKTAIIFHYLLAGGVLFSSTVSFFPLILTGLLSIASTLLIAVLYPARFESKLIFSILYLILGFIAESLSYYFILTFHEAQGKGDLSTLENRLIILLISTLIMLLFILVIRFIKRGQDYKISKAYYLIITFIILISLFILNSLFFYLEKNLFYVFSVIGILMINILIIFLFDKMIEKFRLTDEKRQLQKQMDYQDDSYKKTVHSFNSIKRIIHDINKQLVYIRTCIQENQYQQAIQHINQTLDQINISYQRVNTGNLVVDAMVSNALNIAYDNRITVKHDIRIVAADIRLDRFDLCVVIGNVLDNAIEAVRLVLKDEDKFIHLRIYSNNYALTMQVVNSRREFVNQEHRMIKENPDFHGIGLTNIQRVAEKYGGYLRTEASTNQFETIVVLPFEEQHSHF